MRSSPSNRQNGTAADLRHRSRSIDSEDERRRRHRRYRESEASRGQGARDKYDGRETKRRRSRSPERDSERRHRHDRESRHRSTRESSVDRARTDSKYNGRGEPSPVRKDDARSSREGSATQMTRRNKAPLPSQAAAFQGNSGSGDLVVVGDNAKGEKQKPNLAPTGLLAAASNTITQADGTSIILKYHEPAEARKPPAKDIWKLFVFKGADVVDTIELSMRSCWLVGRERSVVDLAAEHPSISKQHAVIQFRYVEARNQFGDKMGKVKPYLIDLESANGTLLNKDEVPASRYLELQNKDMVQFGHSTREYVLMLSPRD